MQFSPNEIRAMATQLLAGMLANPHLYPQISDDEAQGQQEQILVGLAIDLAESLMDKVEERVSSS